MDINTLIQNPTLFDSIKESDIDDLALQLYPLFQVKIDTTADFLTRKIMAEPNQQSKAAFEIAIKEAMKTSMYSYIANKKWKTNVPLPPYIAKSLYLFSKTTIDKHEGSTDKIKTLVCPACKDLKKREFLIKDDDVLICKTCQDDMKNPQLNPATTKLLEAFAVHSSKGYKCPKCNKFVPDSLVMNNMLTCPYPNCNTNFVPLEIMKHPVSVSNRVIVSINNTMQKSSNSVDHSSVGREFSEKYCNTDINACSSLIDEQEFINDYSVIADIITQQKKAHAYSRQMPNKAAMYDAFINVLTHFPQEMVEYLTIGKQSKEISLQAFIYQEFAKLLKEALPIKIYSNGNEIYIDNPLDERLHLFNGIREFSNFIDQNSVVKKRKEFIYKNDVKEQDNEECFIGEIISITNPDGDDLMQFIDHYGFTSIRLKYDEKVKPGKDIIVKYNSILPNYTMGSMIHLQRIKKKISDSVAKKVNK